MARSRLKENPMQAFIPDPDRAHLVVLTEVDEPQPAADEAVVSVAAYSVNRGETFLLERRPAGWRPGKDVAGTVIRAAADGSGPTEGMRVVAHPPAAGWAERVAVKTQQIAILPESVSDVSAAALPLAGLTALRLLRVAGPLASRRVLMTGASGGVGHYFTELAAAHGAELTVSSATPERGERLRALGAREVVHDVADAKGPFDVVLESVGGRSLQEALIKLKRRGLLIWFGQASRTPPTLDFFRFWEGPSSGSIRHFDYTDSDISDGRDLQTLVSWVSQGRLHPEIGLTDDWSQTDRVLKMLRDRGVRGNAVLTRGAP
jgi:NADPH:quinone reductase